MKSFMRIGSFSCPLQFDRVNNIKVELIRIYYYNFFKTKNKKIKLFGCISRMMCGYSGKSFGRKKRQSFS